MSSKNIPLTLPEDRLWQPVTIRWFIAIFGVCTLYAIVRYHLAGGKPKMVIWYDSGHWPLPEHYLDDQAKWLSRYIEITF